jgi:SpoVK/Ycf46/Vps4 family AAA+-type ATPase
MKAELLKRLFRAIASEDQQAIDALMAIVVEEERRKGHDTLAEQLANLTRRSKGIPSTAPKPPSSGGRIPPGTANPAPNTNILAPLTSKHRFNHPFVVTLPREKLRHHMILSTKMEERFSRIEREYAARDRLAHYGLLYRQKILLYGAPGCGKTMAAERLAWNAGLTLIKVRFDAMVSSYLGETATNLREVFESAAQQPCLLFIDECDSLAKSREDQQEVGEIKRVVNTFLQLLDEYEANNGLLVAATNLTKFLDEAVWRRFDDVIEVPRPTKREIEGILKQTLATVAIGTINWQATVQSLENFSAAQIVRIAQNAAKRAILDREELVIQEHLDASIKDLLASHV